MIEHSALNWEVMGIQPWVSYFQEQLISSRKWVLLPVHGLYFEGYTS